MNKTDRRRLQRLESKAPGPADPPVIIFRTIGETGEPARAACGSRTITPNKGESAEAFKARAVEQFSNGWDTAVLLPERNQ